MQAAVRQPRAGFTPHPFKNHSPGPALGGALPEPDLLGLGLDSMRPFLFPPQEIIQKGHAVTEETFSYLLMGCIQDKKTGFRHALQVCPFWLCFLPLLLALCA